MEVQEALTIHPDVEVICFAGMGEPTLHKQLGEIVDAVRRISKLPISIITNGAHVTQRRVVDTYPSPHPQVAPAVYSR